VDPAQVLDVVREATARLAGVEPDAVTGTSAFAADLGLDSLARVELTADVEEALGGRLLEARPLYAAETVGEYAAAVEAVLGT
jgi:acyl carrier protein